eukprot:8260403-Pyramimonas_sp.AAC.1
MTLHLERNHQGLDQNTRGIFKVCFTVHEAPMSSQGEAGELARRGDELTGGGGRARRGGVPRPASGGLAHSPRRGRRKGSPRCAVSV